MKIGIFSDLHLEFRDYNHYWYDFLNIINSKADEVDFFVSAGDIHPDSKTRRWFFDNINKPVLYVNGNHDFYRSEARIPETVQDIDTSYFIDYTDICGATLWTNFGNNPLVEIAAMRGIADFSQMPGWSVTKCREAFEYHKFKIFDHPGEIVVTHFPPIREGTSHPRFNGNELNPYFSNDLREDILRSNKKLWICGHTHYNFDIMVGDCRVVSNQLGYPKEKSGLYEVKIVEIDLPYEHSTLSLRATASSE